MITFKEIEDLKDDDVVVVTGKEMKELLAITTAIRSGPDRFCYDMGGRLTRAICAATPFDVKRFIS